MSGALTSTQRRLLMLPIIMTGLAYAIRGAQDAWPMWRVQSKDLVIVLGVSIVVASLVAGARIWADRHA